LFSSMDRLNELKGDDADVEKGSNDGSENSERENGDGKDNDTSDAPGKGDDAQYMTEFFENVGQIKAWMSSIRKNIGAIEEVYGHFITAVTSDQTKESSAELDALIDETNGLTHKVRDALQEMQTENEKLEKKEAGSSEARIRTNMHNTLTVKFLDLVTSYQEAQRKYKDKHTEKVRRQIKIVNPGATEEEIQQALDDGAKDIFASQLVDNKFKKQAEDALNYVQNKHKEIQKLEASINELHQLFVDMAILVEAQGELINQIENNVQSARDYTEQGLKQVEAANKYQKKSRKKMCILLICLVAIAVAILAPSILKGVGKI